MSEEQGLTPYETSHDVMFFGVIHPLYITSCLKILLIFSFLHCIIQRNMNCRFLPPGRKLSVRFSIVRPLKIGSSDAVFL